MRTYCTEQGTLLNTLWWPEWEGSPKGKEHMYMCSWLTAPYSRNLYNIVNQLWCCSVAQPCPTLYNPMDCSIPGLSVPHHLLKFSQVYVHCIGDTRHLILWHPLLLLSSIFPIIRDFSYELAVCIRWPKYWSFSFSISPSKEHSGLISLKIDWFDLLIVQGTLRSLLQHHSSKASILWHSASSTVLLSELYVTTGKTKVLAIRALAQ